MAGSDPMVFVMREVFDGKPVLTVYHESDGDWQYLTEGQATQENCQIVHQSHVYEVDSSLRELASMPMGTWAVRHTPGAPWIFGEDTDEENS
ncbi:hypothetical protein [Petropleomorpha daqingensis]|uniref:Uncharacterized protein n=1 Tax=Petropleomorpha daqingensis TaxID=2026353 RepID=A0A853CCB8_9ACTN|nr:hypothetical protein [Petropleomorpha daqingensis]NYJ04048.1 hypothetical protein [Petropleomorpha daqingensis]